MLGVCPHYHESYNAPTTRSRIAWRCKVVAVCHLRWSDQHDGLGQRRTTIPGYLKRLFNMRLGYKTNLLRSNTFSNSTISYSDDLSYCSSPLRSTAVIRVPWLHGLRELSRRRLCDFLLTQSAHGV
jgi:hypothetical protein